MSKIMEFLTSQPQSIQDISKHCNTCQEKVLQDLQELSFINLKTFHPNLTMAWIDTDISDKEIEIILIQQQIKDIQNQIKELKSEIDKNPSRINETDVESLLSNHIQLLHEYNEIKDIGQMLLGKYAELQGTTTSEMYSQFGLDLND